MTQRERNFSNRKILAFGLAFIVVLVGVVAFFILRNSDVPNVGDI